jgi:hypothetical protein
MLRGRCEQQWDFIYLAQIPYHVSFHVLLLRTTSTDNVGKNVLFLYVHSHHRINYHEQMLRASLAYGCSVDPCHQARRCHKRARRQRATCLLGQHLEGPVSCRELSEVHFKLNTILVCTSLSYGIMSDRWTM